MSHEQSYLYPCPLFFSPLEKCPMARLVTGIWLGSYLFTICYQLNLKKPWPPLSSHKEPVHFCIVGYPV